jgi:fructosamine-3-kinase
VLAQGELEGSTYLMLEYVEAAEEGRDFQAGFGRGLARLHRNTHASFGLERNNHIGLLPQVNTPDTDWPRFLVNCRLGPLVRMARDSDRIRPGDVIRFERLYAKLPDLFPPELPALLHGDLWKNNYIAADDGQAVLIDPAAYYGHREMDLAMTRLFGGFDREFYAAYQEEEPLEKGWEERVDLCNLYPLLVHLNLFGGSYAERVGAVLRHYV